MNEIAEGTFKKKMTKAETQQMLYNIINSHINNQ